MDAAKHENELMLYRVYITDCLYAIANKYCEKPVISERYINIVSEHNFDNARERPANIPENNESAVDIAHSLFKQMKRKGGNKIGPADTGSAANA